MPFDPTDIALSLLKIGIVLAMLLNVAPVMNWVERRGSAMIQDRPGPNRVGPFGLFQTVADALKFFFKEDIVPAQAHKFLYTIAPAIGLLPAITTIAVVPWGRPFLLHESTWFGGPRQASPNERWPGMMRKTSRPTSSAPTTAKFAQ